MKHVQHIPELRQSLAHYREKQKIALVPTMGNLHEGHLALVRRAKEVADIVVVSIFVNPLQFGPNEDFAKYPRTLQKDLQKLQTYDVNIVFTPEMKEIYPDLDSQSNVSVPVISDDLCGKFRPHFFYGVTTVVAKLFNIVQPAIALFGEKDFQQLHIIKKMVTDLCFPLSILSVATFREEDGLAMSSRNQYLTANERQKAVHIYKTLCNLANAIISANANYEHLTKTAAQELTDFGFKVDYIEIRTRQNLSLPTNKDNDLIILLAAWLGQTRLIDNMPVLR